MLAQFESSNLIGNKVFKATIAIMILVTPVLVCAQEPTRDALFRIERNKNANIIQYDAQLNSDGLLYSKEPVSVYWVRLAEQGQIKKLSWSQRKFAFGFKLKFDKEKNAAQLDLAVNLGRSIIVTRVAEDYRALVKIDGVASYLERVFIQATGKGVLTRVAYVEFYGKSVDAQEEQYERFSR